MATLIVNYFYMKEIVMSLQNGIWLIKENNVLYFYSNEILLLRVEFWMKIQCNIFTFDVKFTILKWTLWYFPCNQRLKIEMSLHSSCHHIKENIAAWN